VFEVELYKSERINLIEEVEISNEEKQELVNIFSVILLVISTAFASLTSSSIVIVPPVLVELTAFASMI